MMTYFKRQLEKLLAQTANTRPLVYLNGPRQVGKSTLAEHIQTDKVINSVSFDSPLVLTAAKADPIGFIQSLPLDRLNIIDEVQKAPEIFVQLKIAIDQARKTPKNTSLFILTGSANILAVPTLAQELVGRMSILTLLPFSASEYKQTGKNFIDRLWHDRLEYKEYKNTDIIDVIANATFPEIAIEDRINRVQWFDDYLTTILQRDIMTLENIRSPEKIVQLLISLSQRVGSLLNNANIMKETGLDAKTYEKYKALIINTFLTYEVEPWSKPNKLNKRFVKKTKLYFSDTNLLCYIMRRDLRDIYKNDPLVMGHIFENFIASEIMKNLKSLADISVSHFNLSDGKEVDFVLENRHDEAIGIEVKLDKTVSDQDFANIRLLQKTLDSKFKRGIVLYAGNTLLPFGNNIWAVPINYLWE
ncbi:ATPase [Campylobacterota bacterium]|nr:ATPase [Campylobacterota bacterium]